MVKLAHRLQLRFKPKPPYNFQLTVHKPAGWDLFTPFEIYEGGVLWTALHIDGILVGLKMRSHGSVQKPVITIDAFLRDISGLNQKRLITESLASKLSVNEDISEFFRMARKDHALKYAVDDLYGMHDTDFPNLFASAILAISLQMAPMKRSEEMMEGIIKTYGDLAEFDGRRIHVWPTPEKIAKLTDKELAARCKLGYRAKYIVQLAKVLGKGGIPDLEELKQLSPEEAKQKLLELPGIGDYSADIINPHGGFPIDVWSADIFGKLFYGKEPKDGRAAIEKIKAEGIRRWEKWSWMAFLYVVHDLENLSRKLKIGLRLT